MKKVIVMFRIDIGFDPERGYAAGLYDNLSQKQKGIRAGNIRELMRKVGQEICSEEQRKRRFPLEHEREPSRIITPNGFNT
jgi:hypothetical protein